MKEEKEAIFQQYTNSPHTTPVGNSLVPQIAVKEIEVDNKKLKVWLLYDDPEFVSERDWRQRLQHYRMTQGGIIFYDDNDLESAKTIRKWYNDYMLCPNRRVSLIRVVKRKKYSKDDTWIIKELDLDLQQKIGKEIKHYSMSIDEIQIFNQAVRDLARDLLTSQ